MPLFGVAAQSILDSDEGGMGEGCREGGGVRCFSVVFIRFFLLPSNNYYLFLSGISFLFSLPFTGEPVYSFFFLFSSLLPFLKCSTKWGITISFRIVKRIFGGRRRKYLVYVSLPIKRCTMHDARCTIITGLVGCLLRGGSLFLSFL